MRHAVDQSCRTCRGKECSPISKPDYLAQQRRCRIESTAGDLCHFIFIFKRFSSQGRAREEDQGLVISHGPTVVWERETILPSPVIFFSVYPPPWIVRVIVDLYPYVRNCEPGPPSPLQSATGSGRVNAVLNPKSSLTASSLHNLAYPSAQTES